MRIIDNRIKTTICFESLEYGDCFIDENDGLYIRIFSPDSNINAVNLVSGWTFYFERNENVSPVDAELTIN